MLTASALFSVLASALNLSPSSGTAQQMIREAYQEDNPTPEPPRSEDRVYYHLTPDATAPPIPEEIRPAGHSTDLFRYVPYKLTLTFYGPGAEANAALVRSRLYQDGQGNPLSLLRAEGAYPVPRPPMPLLLYEPAAALWRKRVDLTVSLRIAQELELPNSPTVTTAPRVAVFTNGKSS